MKHVTEAATWNERAGERRHSSQPLRVEKEAGQPWGGRWHERWGWGSWEESYCQLGIWREGTDKAICGQLLMASSGLILLKKDLAAVKFVQSVVRWKWLAVLFQKGKPRAERNVTRWAEMRRSSTKGQRLPNLADCQNCWSLVKKPVPSTTIFLSQQWVDLGLFSGVPNSWTFSNTFLLSFIGVCMHSVWWWESQMQCLVHARCDR